jgi:predicted signal transduction protein with EAL and GGDEF domain
LSLEDLRFRPGEAGQPRGSRPNLYKRQPRLIDSTDEHKLQIARELIKRQEELVRESADRQQAEQLADFLESHDPLTRLPNRGTFELELARAVQVAAGRGRILGVMAVGVDRFKRVGQTHGAGHAILMEIGGRPDRLLGRGRLPRPPSASRSSPTTAS